MTRDAFLRIARGRGPTAWSISRRLSFSTGWRISCRRRGSTGTGITGCLHRITGCGKPLRRWRSGMEVSGAIPRRAGMRATTMTREAAVTQITRPKSRDRTTHVADCVGQAHGPDGRGVSAAMPLGVAATSGSEQTAGRSRLTSNRRFTSGRRPGWLRPREVRSLRISANRSSLRPSRPPAAHPSTGASSCRPMTNATRFNRRIDDVPVIDIPSL